MPKQKTLDERQVRKMRAERLHPRVIASMKRHANMKERSKKHNDHMIKSLIHGHSVKEAHKKAVKEVGL